MKVILLLVFVCTTLLTDHAYAEDSCTVIKEVYDDRVMLFSSCSNLDTGRRICSVMLVCHKYGKSWSCTSVESKGDAKHCNRALAKEL